MVTWVRMRPIKMTIHVMVSLRTSTARISSILFWIISIDFRLSMANIFFCSNEIYQLVSVSPSPHFENDMILTYFSKAIANFIYKNLRLLKCREVAAFFHEIKMDQILESLLGPPLRDLENLLEKYTATHRNGNRFTIVYTADETFPVESCRGDASIGQPI